MKPTDKSYKEPANQIHKEKMFESVKNSNTPTIIALALIVTGELVFRIFTGLFKFMLWIGKQIKILFNKFEDKKKHSKKNKN